MSKLEKVLGMLGSEHAGERAAAALKVSNIAKERGVTIVELLRREFGAKLPPRSRETYQPYTHPRERREPDYDVDDDERQLLNRVMRLRSKPLNYQNRQYVYDVIMKKKRDSDLTPHERAVCESLLQQYEVNEQWEG